MLSVGAFRFEDRFCASRKGGTGGCCVSSGGAPTPLAHRCSKFHTYIKCEVKNIKGDGDGAFTDGAFYGLNGCGIYDLNGWGIYGSNGWGG